MSFAQFQRTKMEELWEKYSKEQAYCTFEVFCKIQHKWSRTE